MIEHEIEQDGLRRPVSRREQAAYVLLADAAQRSGLPQPAREAAHRALTAWSDWHPACLALFESEADADARLAGLLMGLLHELSSHAGAGATPLLGLLALGDSSLPGWFAALPRALEAATEPAPTARAEHVGTEMPPLGDWREIGAAITREQRLRTPSSELLVARDSGIRVQLCRPIGWHPVDGWANGSGPAISVRRPILGGTAETTTWRLGVHAWRAYAAVAQGLWVADRLPLDAERRGVLKRQLQGALGKLLAGVWTPRDAIESTAVRIDAAATPESGGTHRRRPESLDFAWPAAHAVVLGAIDRFVSGTEPVPLAEVPPVGTWVHVWDERRREALGGAVVAPPARRGSARRRRGQNAAAGPVVWVQIEGAPRQVPLALARLAQPASWFG